MIVQLYIEDGQRPHQYDLAKSSEVIRPVSDMRKAVIQTRGGATYSNGLTVKQSLDGANAHDFDTPVTITADGITVIDVTDTAHIHIEKASGGSPSGTVELIIWVHNFQP